MFGGPSAVHRATLLVNPGAGGGVARAAVEDVIARLRTGVDRLVVRTPVTAAGAAAAAVDAVAAGADVLVTLGGDGLAQLGAQACAGSGTALAVLPAGTANDLAGGLAEAVGLAPRMPAVAGVLDAARELSGLLGCGARRRIDLGRIVTGPSAGRWWTTVLCAGFGAPAPTTAAETARRLRRHPRPVLDALAGLVVLARLAPGRLVLDTGTVGDTGTGRREWEAILVAVGNGPRYRGGLQICPDARFDDGLFDVTVVGAMSRARLLALFGRLRSGEPVEDPAVHRLRATRVELECAVGKGRSGIGPVAWTGSADGEPVGPLPLAVECVPGALYVVAP